MAKREIEFDNDKYYHIYNRGIDKRNIFNTKGELYYFFDTLLISNAIDSRSSRNILSRKKSKEKAKENQENQEKQENMVEIVAYCLLPNHFHLILKQKEDGGISKFMQRVGNSYVRFFNTNNERSGPLFQGRFRAKEIENLSILSVYVNFNYKHHGINPEKHLTKTSLYEYLGTELGDKVCSKKEIDLIIRESGGVDGYKKDARNYSKYFGEKKGVVLEDIDFDKEFE